MMGLVERDFIGALRPVLIAVVAVTFLAFIAAIALALEAMLMLDVALPGRSGETIAGLLAMVFGTIALSMGSVILRQRLFRQAGKSIAHQLASAASASRFTPAADDGVQADGRDMDRVRSALSGGSVAALCDAATLPLHILILLLLGWPMALALLVGAAAAVAILMFNRHLLWQRIEQADQASEARNGQIDSNRRSQQLLRQFGISAVMRVREQYLELAALDPIDDLDRAVWRSRLTITALVAATITIVGALAVWRATIDRAGIGTIAASLLIASFALWPLRELAARQPQLLRARSAWQRMTELLKAAPAPVEVLPLPAPTQVLNAEGVALAAVGERRVVLQGVTFTMNAGDIAVVVGPSDSGKSMLLRALAGLAPGAIGNVRLDGATLAQYGEAARARHVGYMPQGCELLPGTISQIISGFAEDIDPEAVVRAARTTGAHEVIVRLPRGYDTWAGGPECSLSQSIRQRIALARAFFGEPFLLLLDTPDSFQDRFGRAALGQALEAARARGAIALVTGDSTQVIDAANLAMVLRKGGIADFGPKDEVRQRMQAREKIKSQTEPTVAGAATPAE